RLTVRPHEIVSVLVGRNRSHRSDAEYGPRGGPLDDSIRATHRAPPAISENSVVSAMSIMYIRCVSVLGHLIHVSDLRLFVLKIDGHAIRRSQARRFKSLSGMNPLGMDDAVSLAADRSVVRAASNGPTMAA